MAGYLQTSRLPVKQCRAQMGSMTQKRSESKHVWDLLRDRLEYCCSGLVHGSLQGKNGENQEWRRSQTVDFDSCSGTNCQQNKLARNLETKYLRRVMFRNRTNAE